jgi:hypothetical protein
MGHPHECDPGPDVGILTNVVTVRSPACFEPQGKTVVTWPPLAIRARRRVSACQPGTEAM